jgi:hypothetical protein
MNHLIKLTATTVLLFATATVGHSQSASLGTTKSTDTVTLRQSPPAAYPVHKAPAIRPKKPKPITRELSFGPRLNSNGWGVFADLGKVLADDDKHRDMFYNIRLFQFEFDEVKNPKEIKSNNIDQSSGETQKAYIYGKINDFYTLKLGYGFRKMIAGKPDPGTVSLHWVGVGGLSIGILKPYYLDVSTSGEPIKYTDSTKTEFLNQGDIVGSAGFGKGLGEIKVIPGLHAKTGLHLDFSKNRKTVLAAEAGVDGEIYTKAIPIMANQKAVPYFFNVYLAFQFGRRW